MVSILHVFLLPKNLSEQEVFFSSFVIILSFARVADPLTEHALGPVQFE